MMRSLRLSFVSLRRRRRISFILVVHHSCYSDTGNEFLIRMHPSQAIGEPGYTPSSYGQCAKLISVVGTLPDTPRYCCNGRTPPYPSDQPSARHAAAPLICPVAAKRAE